MIDLSVKDLVKSYDVDQNILDGLTFDVQAGERVGIMGRNGAGKSTLLNMIAGELTPDSGSVDFGGTVRIGYFTQEGRELDPSQRPYDYIHEVASEVHTKEGRLSATQMMERFLFPSDLQFSTIGRLSGGERRRLYLLGILMSAPNILLLDEPTSFLDIRYKLEFLDALRRLSRERGFTVIMSLHEVELAAEFSDRIAVLANGRLDRLAAPADILKEGYIADAFSVPAHLRGSLPKGLQ